MALAKFVTDLVQMKLLNYYQIQQVITLASKFHTAHDKKTGQQYIGEQLLNLLNEQNLIYYKQLVRGVIVDWDN